MNQREYTLSLKDGETLEVNIQLYSNGRTGRGRCGIRESRKVRAENVMPAMTLAHMMPAELFPITVTHL